MWRVMLALALALQQLGLCAPAAPEWNLEGLDEAAEPAAVTLTEVRAACQTETATCEKDDECATALAESFAPGSVPHPHPPQKLIDVLKCFKSGNSLESAKRIKAAAEKADNIKAITDDIACQFCGHLVEDMWSMVVQNVYQHQVQSSVEQEARMWLEDLCHLGKQKTLSTLEKFIGLYDISPSEEDRPDGNGKQYRIDRDVPWADDPAGAYSPTFGYVGEYEDAVVTKSTLEERQWMLRVFAQLCVDYVQGSDLEIAESLAAQVTKYQKGFDRIAEEPEAKGDWNPEARVLEMIAEGTPEVVAPACAQICEESGGGKKKMKKKGGKKKKKAPKKAKGKKEL